MTNRLGALINRVKNIYQEEGLLTTIKKILTSVISVIYTTSAYNVYVRTLTKDNEADRMPKIQNVTPRIVETIQQLDELYNQGFDLSLLDIDQYRYRLERGAIATFAFVDRELGFAGWGALSEEAKKSFTRYPFKVDFANNEALGGDAWTNPKYRRQGLHNYVAYKWDQFLISRGITKDRAIILSSNITSQRSTTKMGSKLVARARYVCIFGLQFWRERPVG